MLRARVRDARYGAAVFVEGRRQHRAGRPRMRDNDINALFVRDDGRVGVVTGMNLSKAVVLRRLPLDTPVREVCHSTWSRSTPTTSFDALLMMTRTTSAASPSGRTGATSASSRNRHPRAVRRQFAAHPGAH